MTVFFSDNFDTDTLGAIAPGWVAKQGTWAVGTDRVVSGARSFGTVAGVDADTVIYTGNAAAADMGMQFDFVIDGIGRGFGAGVRFDVANANGYLFLIYGLNNVLNCATFKKVGGAFTQLTLGDPLGISAPDGTVVHVRATSVGSTMSVYVSTGANALPTTATRSFTDTSVTAPGYPMIYRATNQTSSASGSIDNFQFDDAATGASATAVTLSLSASTGAVGSPVTVTVGANAALTGAQSESVTLTSTVAGTFSVSPVTLNATTQTATSVFTPSAAGTATITAAATGTPTLTNGTATYTASATSNNALTSGTTNILFSPYNWNVGASTAKTINAGAYFKTIFTGTTCTLQFDMTGIASPLPQISYRVDGTGAWITATLGASVVLTLPSGSNMTTDYASKGGHLLEVVVKSMTETQSRWTPQSTAVSLTGIVLDSACTLTKPIALPLNAIFYGDSITEGVRTLNGTTANDTDRNDAAQGWAYRTAQILGAEVGIVGFGATGLINAGSGGVPALPTSYNLLYSGVSRSFTVAPDFIVLMEGTNDGGDVTSNATTVLNSLISVTPVATKIVVLRPFNGTAHATQLQNAIAACTAPARCTYVDTAGWFNTANSYDGLHPYGNENLNHIAPLAANAIRPLLQITRGARTTRTVTLTLNDRTGAPRANLSGLKWAFFDQSTAGALTVNADGGTSATTNASGVLTLSVQTTLAAGGTGWLVVSDSAGVAGSASNAFSAPVTVA